MSDPTPGPADRAKEGLDHLQAAALEAIAAARALLDVAEEVVREPGAIGDVARTVVAMAAALRPEAPADDGTTAAPRQPASERSASTSNVRRIPLS